MQGSYKSFDELLAWCYRLLGESGAIAFVHRLVLSIANANADMHLKNWSVLYESPNTPLLAPAYDYVCTAACAGYDDFLALPLAKVRHWNAIRRDTFLSAARTARVHPKMILRAVDGMCERLLDRWPAVRDQVPEAVARIVERQLALPLLAGA